MEIERVLISQLVRYFSNKYVFRPKLFGRCAHTTRIDTSPPESSHFSRSPNALNNNNRSRFSTSNISHCWSSSKTNILLVNAAHNRLLWQKTLITKRPRTLLSPRSPFLTVETKTPSRILIPRMGWFFRKVLWFWYCSVTDMPRW